MEQHQALQNSCKYVVNENELIPQEIHLDKNVKLLDCPGIVFSNKASENDIVLRNAVRIEQIPDPIAPGMCLDNDIAH